MVTPVFPTLLGLGFPVTRSPIWKTVRQEAQSGKATTFALWSFPRYKYNLPFNFLRNDILGTDYQKLLAFFNAVQGSADLFQYNDPDDNTATNSKFGIGDGSTTSFQLYRSTSTNLFDPVFSPVTIASVDINGSPTSSYTLASLGIVQFASPPPLNAVLTWSGSFTWLCRFDADTTDFEKFLSNWWRTKAITFTTEKF